MKSIPGGNYIRYDHHIKGCMVGLTFVIGLLHCSTNDIKNDLTPQEIAQKLKGWIEKCLMEEQQPSLFL